MANRNRYIKELETDLGPAHDALSSSSKHNREMSSRNKRGANRNNNGNSGHGEEANIWDNCKPALHDIVAAINADNDNLKHLLDMDKEVGAMDSDQIPGSKLKAMEEACRKGVKSADNCYNQLKAVITQLEIIKGVVDAKETAEAAAAGPTGKRGGRGDSVAAAALYEFDNAGESPGPSPLGGSSSRKYGRNSARDGDRERDRERDRARSREREKDRDRERDSVPPKADSVEPQGSVGSGVGGSSSSNRKAQAVFTKGESVAFRPVASAEPSSDWILGKVAQVIGEGKARRYKVLDVEPEDPSKQKEYRTTAKSMIAITPASQSKGLKPWEAGQVVLALYPNTTTFYKAEVHSMEDEADIEEGEEPKVNLKFEGENDMDTVQQVERRFVIEYRA
jgi:SAGA-associated factor 29